MTDAPTTFAIDSDPALSELCSGYLAARAPLLAAGSELIDACVARKLAQVGVFAERDELTRVATTGLLAAAVSWDPAISPFSVAAIPAINGAISDYLYARALVRRRAAG